MSWTGRIKHKVSRTLGIDSLREKIALVRRLAEEVRGLRTELQSAVAKIDRLDNGGKLADTDRLVADIDKSIAAQIAERFDCRDGYRFDAFRIREYEGLLRHLRRESYLEAIRTGRLAVPRLKTEHPIAIHTNDTLAPRGAKNDNSICLRFNQSLYGLLGDRPAPLKILDIGCAGGGLVRSLIDDGHFAVGLEGCDYPKKLQLSEWGTIPHHLHTCDVTQPFSLTDAATGDALQFDAITAFELMEHIGESDLSTLLDNFHRHLAPNGYMLFSIATFQDRDEALGLDYHQTVRPRTWWKQRFFELGFETIEDAPVGRHDWLRGSGNVRWDWDETTMPDFGFHIVLRKLNAAASLSAAA